MVVVAPVTVAFVVDAVVAVARTQAVGAFVAGELVVERRAHQVLDAVQHVARCFTTRGCAVEKIDRNATERVFVNGPIATGATCQRIRTDAALDCVVT